jgi:hypothetical protein
MRVLIQNMTPYIGALRLRGEKLGVTFNGDVPIAINLAAVEFQVELAPSATVRDRG